MTNEKLAALAQDPDNKELIPVLWDKVKDLLYMKADRAYRQYSNMFARCGVELADIRQSCYIVFLDALKGYQPDGETKFTSYLNYPFQTMLKELTHTRTSRKEPLNDATSLDKPIQDKDGDADATMVDLLPDSSIDLENDVLDPLERDEEQQMVRDAVARLPEQQRNVIESTYFLNQAQKEIAAHMGCRPQNVHRLQVQAFQIERFVRSDVRKTYDIERTAINLLMSMLRNAQVSPLIMKNAGCGVTVSRGIIFAESGKMRFSEK